MTTVNFDQFNVSVLNKSITFFKKKTTTKNGQTFGMMKFYSFLTSKY